MIKRIRPLFLPVLLAGAFTACQSSSPETGEAGAETVAALTTESYEQYLTALAADDMEGRKPFTSGEQKTLDYLEREFKALGVEPGNDGSYFQEVPMVEVNTTASSNMTIKGKQQELKLEGRNDYVIWTKRTDESINIDPTDMVFVGFGVVAPEYNWNDYAGLDVKDKIVVMLVNDPGFYTQDLAVFKGKAMTYYGRWTYKFEEAARQGAKGVLIIHDTEPAGYGFQVVQNNWNTSKMYLDSRGSETYKCAMEGWITTPVAEKLFAAAGMDYKSVLSRASKPGNKPFPLNLQASTSLKVKTRYDKTSNFIAKITGSTRPDETIIYTGHWDHLGIGKADATGDSIYNGAVDNASGVAGLLEIAKAFKNQPTQPERTVVFLAVTAEEQGLWGSAYYAENPVFPKEKTVANINMDMMNPYGKTKDVVLYGMGQSELEDYITAEAEAAGRYIAPEENPEAGLYYRSDHFNFAKIGIPALFIGPGVDLVNGGKELGKKKLDEYYANYYHKAADQVHPDYKMDGVVEDLKLLYQVGHRLAGSSEWPQWKAGSEFKAVRESYMNN
ncbi:M28 family metallopeptidase [Pontibacter lucknowensis]|uniref:Zn-dependent amino-or carboxypeptidase, M28 family n=1 Tax=Pontibacter lucknowensis TaxID=1077936 RepID=A0A1N6TXX0_9BACT|nr:M28 family metallopeptidase [Pontibacter lucknowensis]SIQ58230.1 Zn-dependent amino-or carboxypeptidase, M28 family [Pontibacter lucknowensis]